MLKSIIIRIILTFLYNKFNNFYIIKKFEFYIQKYKRMLFIRLYIY